MKIKAILMVTLVCVLTFCFSGTSFASQIYIDLQEVKADVAPQIINERTMVPVRAIAEMVGCRVEWIADKQQVEIYEPMSKVLITVMQIGNKTANDRVGVECEMDSPPIIINDRTFVPLRFISEIIGYKVDYNVDNGNVYLFSPAYINNQIGEGKGSETKSINYESYKGDWNLKVAGDEEIYLFTCLEVYFGVTGINIAEINNNSVKGSIYSILGAPGYRQAEVAFEGKIENGKLLASYKDDAWLYSGNIELSFENEKLVANITRDKVDTTPMWGIPEGKFSYIRPIESKLIDISGEEKKQLEQFFAPIAKDRIMPFSKGTLTDETIVNFVGINLGAGYLPATEFGNKVREKDGKVIFDESVMNDLAKRYFGIGIKEHKSYGAVTYEKGVYSVPALGGVSEYPLVQLLMKDTKNEGTYYAIVDFIFDYPDQGKQLEYEYLIEMQKSQSYTIKAIKEIKSPIGELNNAKWVLGDEKAITATVSLHCQKALEDGSKDISRVRGGTSTLQRNVII
ncbi:MAG: copper amine oxidase N-terminal domain-containing protein [Herbinix sp.]|nr:copper amine oxidase N-terminal domain-containing protein [Herbinix sp.]